MGRKRGDPKKADQSLPPAPTADRARDGAEVARSSDAPRDANIIKARQIVIRRERAEPRVPGAIAPRVAGPPALALRARPRPPAERAIALPNQACHRARKARARRIGVVVEASEGMLGFSLTREPGSLGASFHARSEASPLPARSRRAPAPGARCAGAPAVQPGVGRASPVVNASLSRVPRNCTRAAPGMLRKQW